jgi:peptidoglycan/xylan/chitin deacetylase (PgdA/CDA1 family)
MHSPFAARRVGVGPVAFGAAVAPGPPRPVFAPARPGLASVIDSGPTAGREVAITFDDGFCKACARRIVGYLLRAREPATIFPNGVYGSVWDPLAGSMRRLVAEGLLTIGNHTFHHWDAVGVGPQAFAADLALNERWIETTFGVTARPFFRPPYGAYNRATVAAAGAAGYTRVIMWSGTLADSGMRTIAYLLHAIRVWAKPGAIILCHANWPPTSFALPRIYALLRRLRLRPVTIGQLLRGVHARPTTTVRQSRRRPSALQADRCSCRSPAR